MSIANSKLRRAEPRTADDLRRRGWKLLSMGRGYGYAHLPRRDRPPVKYKLVPVGSDDRHAGYGPGAPWAGMIEGHPHQSVALPVRKDGHVGSRPLKGGPFESRVAAAHALLDFLWERDGKLPS